MSIADTLEKVHIPVEDEKVPVKETLPFSTPDFGVEHSESIAGIGQSDIHLESEDIVKLPSLEAEVFAKPSDFQERTHGLAEPAQMAEFQPRELSRPASPVTDTEKIRNDNEEKSQLQERSVCGLNEEKSSIETSQRLIVTSALIPETDIQRFEPLSPSEKKTRENQFFEEDAEEYISLKNEQNKENEPQVPSPTPKGLESYQIPEGLVEYIPTPVAAKPKSPDVPRAAVEEAAPNTEIGQDIVSPQENVIQQSEAVEENHAAGHKSAPMEASLSVTSVPMTPTLSEVNKRRSKKARQREKKRKSLQGVDISGSSVASAEMSTTPSVGDFPSGVPILRTLSTGGGSPITKTQPATPMVSPNKNTGSKVVENVKQRENERITESMSEGLKQ